VRVKWVDLQAWHETQPWIFIIGWSRSSLNSQSSTSFGIDSARAGSCQSLLKAKTGEGFGFFV
jgi:hypothetical protein